MTQTGSSDPLQSQRQIEALCDEFEESFRSGNAPRIEDYLARVPDRRRNALRALLRVEVRLGAGSNSADVRDYRGRFPADKDIVDEVLAESISASTPPTPEADFSSSSTIDRKNEIQSPDTAPADCPERIGRYQVKKLLGKGAFGCVYLAHDSQLERLVAVKVPSRKFFTHMRIENFLAEARNAARLKHVGLVAVYDVQMEVDPPFIVQEYVDGCALSEWSRSRPRPGEAFVPLLVKIVDAVGFAHQHGLIHRDLKPANVLVDADDLPHVADFGLAVHESAKRERRGEVSGSPAYMSPEQVRGETHRLDGRTDIWSLGVVLYEMLCGRRPFKGSDRHALFDEILTVDPTPLRQWRPALSKELERICLKCLEKRRVDRYLSAADLRDDLSHWLASREGDYHPAGTPPVPSDEKSELDSSFGSEFNIVPKGIRAFDHRDTDFFLALLPGPLDRDGVPESIRFWTTRIGESESADTFGVGLLYGPSGCGKTSLVKAGLLPRLPSRVIPIYIEATPEETEARLLNALVQRVPRTPIGESLPDTLLHARERAQPGTKVLIVIDQFEQWLHVHGGEESNSLIDALRQCDGDRVQCVVMVRDDFWMAVTRFFRSLEIRLVEGVNSSAVDLFPCRHARKVLTSFGRAYGCIEHKVTPSQREFIAKSVESLSEDGKVVCLRLALFADMVNDKVWSPASLKEMGGAQGLGVTFLEETFTSLAARRELRLHQSAAREVLTALLPEQGSKIRGSMQSRDHLLKVSGYAAQPDDFEALLRILDGELRLITPTSPEGGEPEDDRFANRSESSSQPHYQLTHDYLVPSLREWLELKLKSSRRGRAQLALAARTAMWHAKPEAKQLPTWQEWIRILGRTRRRTWSPTQRKMMAAATKLHLSRTTGCVGVILVLVFVTLHGWSMIAARDLTNRLLEANTLDVPAIIEQLEDLEWSEYFLTAANRRLDARTDDPRDLRKRTHLGLALLRQNGSQKDLLFERLLVGDPGEVHLIRKELLPHLNEKEELLWGILGGLPGFGTRERLRAASALALVDPDSSQWPTVAPSVAAILVAQQSVQRSDWASLLEPARKALIPALRDLSVHAADPSRSSAAGVLSHYLRNNPTAIATVIRDVHPLVISALLQVSDAERLASALQTAAVSLGDVNTKDERQVRALGNLTLARMFLPGEVENWELLAFSPDPTLRTYLTHNIPAANVDATKIIDYLLDRPYASDDVELSRERALLLSLANQDAEILPSDLRRTFVGHLHDVLVKTHDPGLRGAAQYLLQTWNEEVPEDHSTDRRLVWPNGSKCWYRCSNGHTMIIVGGMDHIPPNFALPYAYAISDTEVTVKQFLDFLGDAEAYEGDFNGYDGEVSPSEDCPIISVSIEDAWRYCLWLSKSDGIPESEWCYRLSPQGIEQHSDILTRSGYRLPTSVEWEVACRAGTTTPRFFGESVRWLNRYAWTREQPTALSPQMRTQPVGRLMPNDIGLFDIYGNVGEWCLDPPGTKTANGGTYTADAKRVVSLVRPLGPGRIYSTKTYGFRIARTVKE